MRTVSNSLEALAAAAALYHLRIYQEAPDAAAARRHISIAAAAAALGVMIRPPSLLFWLLPGMSQYDHPLFTQHIPRARLHMSQVLQDLILHACCAGCLELWCAKHHGALLLHSITIGSAVLAVSCLIDRAFYGRCVTILTHSKLCSKVCLPPIIHLLNEQVDPFLKYG